MPQRLILGMRPSVRLETGIFLLEPYGRRVQGRSLYLGITLAQSLGKDELEDLIESALSRAAGPHSSWLPEAQDAYLNAAEVLRYAKLARVNGEIGNESDPALEACALWLSCWARLSRPYEEEDAAAACSRKRVDR